ncbi:MAG: 23S rRNA (guanosine(2251)-2'-O)-methyltransferase RlmB [Acholeplasmatales bacterium]|jgi:23S rRNA (guanosine2251-2'-O)-methyltransferase/cation-transporting ATPase E|nr:23S rRNA (guanosine(2251)-2'-O)-methyltransferase RlmB [Acholeplasmatales bacterium]
MIIYGKNACKESIINKHEVNLIYLDEKCADKELVNFVKNSKIPFNLVSKAELNNLSNIGSHQGICMDVKDYKTYELDEVLVPNKNLRFILLDEVTDPHNLGSIIRTSEASGIDAIILTRKNSCPITPAVVKVSTGSIERVKLVYSSNIVSTIKKLKEYGCLIIGSTMDSKISYKTIDKDRSLVLCMGSEGDGLRHIIKMNCDLIVSIPMKGKINSLNVGVAAGILVYEIMY